MTTRKCSCGIGCWFADVYPELLKDYPCSGSIGVSEEWPGIYIHFCDAHGNPEDSDAPCHQIPREVKK